MHLSSNVGPRERWIRVGLGVAALLAAASPRMGRWRWLFGAIGVTNVATAALTYCPTNALLGIDNTRGREVMHFDRSRKLGRRINRWQRHVGATL